MLRRTTAEGIWWPRLTRLVRSEIALLLNELFESEEHAKRAFSLANATLDVTTSASLAVHAIGQGLAHAQGLTPKHAVKQVDRLLIIQRSVSTRAVKPLVCSASKRVSMSLSVRSRRSRLTWTLSTSLGALRTPDGSLQPSRCRKRAEVARITGIGSTSSFGTINGGCSWRVLKSTFLTLERIYLGPATPARHRNEQLFADLDQADVRQYIAGRDLSYRLAPDFGVQSLSADGFLKLLSRYLHASSGSRRLCRLRAVT